MPTVRFAGKRIQCKEGDNLRSVMLNADVSPYNGAAKALNCRGNGLCGMCAVRVRGTVSWPTSRENFRVGLSTAAREATLRLACQCTVAGDVVIEKYQGVFGTSVEHSVRYGRKRTSRELNVDLPSV